MAAKKRFFVADQETDLNNGWTIETNFDEGTKQFWEDADRQVGCGVRLNKAIEVDRDCQWVGRDICFR